ncbi:glycosyltransferase family 9 protein [Dysgonomonas sp. GY617]|uniref:glycosyltransferase family 9 protein n=1 Tax=Dysgonomonas sp. GY617 TaxID=2780420 RepID=UPI001883FE62|nr:glycosyltransferase family 9 protein [Dysgonomonas sp. GY617]MBF0575067.1 glycosyltransferase family 9 protein [Dysgonomonas sp. GY617]
MQIRNILIIRFRRVGDATLSTVLCTSLKKSFPNAKIHYVLNENIATLFEHHPDIDKIVTFSDYDMSSTKRYISKVKSVVSNVDYDIIIDTRSTIRTMLFSLFSLKTPYRIGRRKAYNRFIHNYRVDNFPDGTRDNVQLNLDLLNPLEKDFNIYTDPYFKLFVTKEEKEAFAHYMESKDIDLSKPIILCAITARLEFKAWEKIKMKEIIDRILDKYQDAQLIFNYAGYKEKEVAEEIHKAGSHHPRVFINIEAVNLRELSAMISNVNFFFGNEGGPRHIAQAFGIPSFAIFPPCVKMIEWLPNPSPSNQGIELPNIDPMSALDKNLTFEQKLALIDINSVWKELDKMLEKYISR